jgi:hypothetical protein
VIKNFPEGHPRPYVRDGVADLPREQQLTVLRDAGVPLDQLFEDRLSRRQIKARSYADLKDLAEMLRPTTRTTPETIFVASLRVLGWDIADIARSIAAAGRRHAAIVALDTNQVIPAGAGPEVLDLLADIEDQQQRARKSATLSKGREAAKRRRDNRWQRARVIAIPLWGKPSEEWSAEKIAKELADRGLKYSVKTLYNRLGTREEAQRRTRKECA